MNTTRYTPGFVSNTCRNRSRFLNKKPWIISGLSCPPNFSVSGHSLPKQESNQKRPSPSRKFGRQICHGANDYCLWIVAYPERLLIWNAGVFRNAFIGITNIAPLVWMGWGLVYWAPSYVMLPELNSWYTIPGTSTKTMVSVAFSKLTSL